MATDMRQQLLRRIQGEYLEMPGVCLTREQARRLWALDQATCDTVLTALVEAKFLYRTRSGAYARLDTSMPSRHNKELPWFPSRA